MDHENIAYFSPYDMRRYQCKTHLIPNVISKMQSNMVPTWNFYWLLAPWIDPIPETGAIGAGQVDRLASAVITDIARSESLRLSCMSSPDHFLDWVTSRKRTITRLHTTSVVGQNWRAVTIPRAEEAAARMAEAVIKQASKPVWINQS
jgi:hypothetical protein